MSDQKPPAGALAWLDLTVANADDVRDFYTAVAGWQPQSIQMDGYSDYAMAPAGSDSPVAGICHKRGSNADFPSHWLIYIAVDDLDKSISECERLGGKVVIGPTDMGADRYCVIEDPAGAVAALYQKG